MKKTSFISIIPSELNVYIVYKGKRINHPLVCISLFKIMPIIAILFVFRWGEESLKFIKNVVLNILVEYFGNFLIFRKIILIFF